MEERIIVENKTLGLIKTDLKERGYLSKEIKEIIGARISELMRVKSISKDVFLELEELYGEEIEHEKTCYVDGFGLIQEDSIPRSEKLAELVGIILGDGHIHYQPNTDQKQSQYYVSVTTHEDETELINHAENLMTELIGKEPLRLPNCKFNSLQLRLTGIEGVIRMKNCGLKSGNKVEQQVGVPEWIKRDKNYTIKCLRGLIDTDGTIYKRNHDGYYVAQFKNRSYKLLSDFKEMCETIDIKCSKSGEFQVQVASQKELEKFIKKVDPIKQRT